MPRFKAHIRDGRRKLADLEVDVRTLDALAARPARRAATGVARAARHALSNRSLTRRFHKPGSSWKKPRQRSSWGAFALPTLAKRPRCVCCALFCGALASAGHARRVSDELTLAARHTATTASFRFRPL
jgi:hypothetical protein